MGSEIVLMKVRPREETKLQNYRWKKTLLLKENFDENRVPDLQSSKYQDHFFR